MSDVLSVDELEEKFNIDKEKLYTKLVLISNAFKDYKKIECEVIKTKEQFKKFMMFRFVEGEHFIINDYHFIAFWNSFYIGMIDIEEPIEFKKVLLEFKLDKDKVRIQKGEWF